MQEFEYHMGRDPVQPMELCIFVCLNCIWTFLMLSDVLQPLKLLRLDVGNT